MGYPISMKDRAEEAHRISKAKGWWSERDLERARARDPELIAAKLALIHTEVSEALEAIRDHVPDSGGEWVAVEGGITKPQGFASELADVVIRVFDLAEATGVSIQDAVRVKCRYNQQRPHRHGGKAL